MPVIKQLLAEFWFPFLVALAWTLYNALSLPPGGWSIRVAVNLFGPTFFFVSWLLSQWYRIRKQQKVEGGLSSIEASVKQTLVDLEAKTADLVGYITGGDSACYLSGHPEPSGRIGYFNLVHVGRHPLYDVRARIVDLEAFAQIEDSFTFETMAKTETHRHFGDLIPGHASMLPEALELGPVEKRSFNIFYTARNGGFVQMLRFRKVENSWLVATKVMRGDILVHEHVLASFPRTPTGEVEW